MGAGARFLAVTQTYVGQSVLRVEDEPLLRGAGRYLDDLKLAGTQHLAVVRSPLAHARVLSVDSSEAEAAPGVSLVLTGADLAGMIAPPKPREDRRIPPRPLLATDVVRMVGDPVAVVVADDPARARDAADLVFVDYEPLEVVSDPETALDRPPIYPEYGDNVAFDRSHGSKDDVDACDAAIVVEGVVQHPRVVPAPLEPRGALATWQDDDLTLYLGTQAPALMADELAWVLDLPKDRIRIIVPDMGGAFGSKFDLAEEELLVVEAARRAGTPVKWVETRREHFMAIGHGRAQRHAYKAAADADGRLLGLWIESLVDMGARKRYIAGPPYTPRIGTGNYAVPTYSWRQYGVFTNRAPQGIYRGAGRPEATLTVERIMDRIAGAAGIDPAEVRRRNFVTEFPYESPGGAVFDSGDYHRALDVLLEAADYDGLRARQVELRDQGRLPGIGLCAYVEATAFERFGRAIVDADASGRVRVRVGTLDHGQGHRTTFAQIAADILGLDPADIVVSQGDTTDIPFGFGTSGSRSVAHGGGAVQGGASVVADKVARIVAHLLEADPADIVLARGRVDVAGAPGSGMSWAEAAAAAHDPDRLPPGEEPGLSVDHRFDSGGITFPFGMHLAVVDVDADTGIVALEQVWAVDDCGVVVNPMLAAGQRHGGLAQGLGQALTEEVLYDEDGNLVTSTFLDYLLPSATQVPAFELLGTVTPSSQNPLGAKGVAESGAIGLPPAIVNAVVDALAPLGVNHLDLPLRPERVWRAMQR